MNYSLGDFSKNGISAYTIKRSILCQNICLYVTYLHNENERCSLHSFLENRGIHVQYNFGKRSDKYIILIDSNINDVTQCTNTNIRNGSIQSCYLEIGVGGRRTISLHCYQPGRWELELTLGIDTLIIKG